MADGEDLLAATGKGAAAGAMTGNPYLAAAGAAVGLAGGIYSMWSADKQSDKIKKASAEQKKAIAAILAKIEAGWQTPDLDSSALTPTEIKILKEYAPTVAQYTEEQAPQIMRGAGQEQGISAQKEALSRLQAQAGGAPDEQAQAEQALGQEQAAAQGRSNRANILRDMAQRGLGGSGQDILAQMAGAGQAEQMARTAGLQAQSGAAQRRAEALRQMTGLAGQMRGAAQQQEASNVSILNSFNERATMRKQAYDQYKAAQENEAQLRNMTEAQRVLELNARNTDAAAIRAQELRNANATTLANNANAKLGMTTGMEAGQANAGYNAATNAAQTEGAGRSAIAEGATRLGAAALTRGMSGGTPTPTGTTTAVPAPTPETSDPLMPTYKTQAEQADADSYSWENERRGGTKNGEQSF